MENKRRLFTTVEFRVATPVAPSAQAEKTVEVLQANGATEACIVGRASVLTQKRVVGDWTFVPWDQDTSAMPPIAWQRVMALQEAGIHPISYVIAHEPKQNAKASHPSVKEHMAEGLAKAKTQVSKVRAAATPVAQQAAVTAKQWGKAAAPVARQAFDTSKRIAIAAAPVVWDVTKVTLMVAGAAALAVGAAAVYSLGALAMIDPCLYAILPADDGGDPVWVLVSRWYE